jgi:hypothetical protein
VTWPKHSTVPLLIEIPDNPSRALLQRFHSEISKLETTSPATPYLKPGNNYLHADGKIQWPNQRNVPISSLVEAWSDATEFLPASAYKCGGSFRISFLSEFQSLDSAAQGRVEAHYRSLAGSVSQVTRKQYPNVIR